MRLSEIHLAAFPSFRDAEALLVRYCPAPAARVSAARTSVGLFAEKG